MELNLAQLALVTSDHCTEGKPNTPNDSRGKSNRKENQNEDGREIEVENTSPGKRHVLNSTRSQGPCLTSKQCTVPTSKPEGAPGVLSPPAKMGRGSPSRNEDFPG